MVVEDHSTRHDETESEELSRGFQLVIVLAALALILLIAGIPGTGQVAGNGSEDLRRGWAEQRQAAVGIGPADSTSVPVDR